MISYALIKVGLNTRVVFSLYDREKYKKKFCSIIFLILFSKFRSLRIFNPRYFSSRLKALNITKKLLFYSNVSYSFSHSKNYSAVLVSSSDFHVSIDIEPNNRKISKYLSLYLSDYFADVKLSSIEIISILECLVKIGIIESIIDSQGGLMSLNNINISSKNRTAFIKIQDKMFYSKFIVINGFHACITSDNSDYLNNIIYVD